MQQDSHNTFTPNTCINYYYNINNTKCDCWSIALFGAFHRQGVTILHPVFNLLLLMPFSDHIDQSQAVTKQTK